MIKKMDIVSKLRQDFVIEKIKKTNWSKGTNAPLIVELDPTAVCDLACPGCISEDIIATNNSFSSNRLLEIGRELKDMDVKGVIFIGGGEPLAHPAFGDLIRYFGLNDISSGITTNGTFINRYLNEIAEYSSWTRVSIDASSEEIFSILRPTKGGKSKFSIIIENMRKLAKIKVGKLGYSFLVRSEAEGDGMISNIHEIYSAAVLAKDIGCDYFEVKPSYNYKNDVAHSLVKHSPERMQELRQEMEKLDDLVDESFSVTKAITLDSSIDGVRKHQVKKYTTCPATELRTLITPLGTYVCPYWRGKENFMVGDAKTTNFKELWNSFERRSIQSWLDPSKHCSQIHCLRDESNVEILNLINDIKNNKQIDVLDEYDRFI